MSSATVRVPLAEAEQIANILVADLKLTCKRIVIAGSIRRRRPDTGDIDLVCEPSTEPVPDLFGMESGEHTDRLHERLNWMLRHEFIAQRLDANGRPAWGRSLKRAIYSGVALDIQSVIDPDVWGAWLLIRTGPGRFSKWIVGQRMHGGALSPGMEFKDGFRFYKHGGFIPTPDERSVFDAIGIPFIPPEERDEFVRRMVK